LLVLGKGNKERFVLINPETAEALLNKHIEKYHLDSMQEINGFIEDHKESLLFSKKNGEAFTEKNVYDIIKTGSLQILKRDVRPHELRHERANELEKKGVSILDIKNYLGHTRIATTEIYLHKSGEESLNKIEELS
jgi:site-specific recombinase XerD